MTILLLETATQICSVALERDGQIIDELHSEEPNAHSSKLSVFIGEIMRRNSDIASAVDAVCVSSGPGSYTGLRIGVSSAKGICYAKGIPLLAVPTLHNMAMLFFGAHPDYNGLVCPMIDARRMECYTAIFDRQGQRRSTMAEVITPESFDAWLGDSPVTFIGDGAAKTKALLAGKPHVHYDDTFAISAAGMAAEAERKLRSAEIEDTAYFEPFYLKDFVAKKSVVHGLRK
jgi:tRNA threonylcarbamoyladenosine biosynthesis protein TsaB